MILYFLLPLVSTVAMNLNPRSRLSEQPTLLLVIFAVCFVTIFPSGPAFAQFDIQLSVVNPGDFTDEELALTEEAMLVAESLWESVIVGYQPGITQVVLPITISGVTTGPPGLAGGTGTIQSGGFFIHTGGEMFLNFDTIELLADFPGSNVNVLDELIAHEIGHVLGIGNLWQVNAVSFFGSGQYTGEFGLAAYQEEFDPTATFIPVELGGTPVGTADLHFDQILRGAGEAGEGDPLTLSPLTGITDDQGRDLAGELLTAALDPDLGEPFLSNFTVQSLRDIGFEVVSVPEPSGGFLPGLGALSILARRRRERRPRA